VDTQHSNFQLLYKYITKQRTKKRRDTTFIPEYVMYLTQFSTRKRGKYNVQKPVLQSNIKQ